MRPKNDARKSPRHKAALLVKFQKEGDVPPVEVRNLSDVSLGGFKFLTDSELQPGEVKKVSILLPLADDPISVDAGIVRVGPSENSNYQYEVGVEFCQFEGKDKELLSDYLKLEAKRHGFFGFLSKLFH